VALSLLPVIEITIHGILRSRNKNIFSKHSRPKAVNKRVSKKPITSNLKIEFFKDQCSFEEDGAVFPVVNSTGNIPSLIISR
jgi:hypothetical protein